MIVNLFTSLWHLIFRSIDVLCVFDGIVRPYYKMVKLSKSRTNIAIIIFHLSSLLGGVVGFSFFTLDDFHIRHTKFFLYYCFLFFFLSCLFFVDTLIQFGFFTFVVFSPLSSAFRNVRDA